MSAVSIEPTSNQLRLPFLRSGPLRKSFDVIRNLMLSRSLHFKIEIRTRIEKIRK